MSNPCEGELDPGGLSGGQGRSAGNTGNGRGLVLAIWLLAVFTAFLFGSTIVNVVVSRKAYLGSERQVEAIKTLNDSMLELRKSIAEFSTLFQEAQEMDRGSDDGSFFQNSYVEEEKV